MFFRADSHVKLFFSRERNRKIMHPTLSKLLRELQHKIESVDKRLDVMDKKLNKIQKQEVETKSQLNDMALVQRMGDETLRKSANSINVLVRLVSVSYSIQ